MNYSQEEIRCHLEAFQGSNRKDGFAISIKLQVPGCFCREHHAPMANCLIDDYQKSHPLDPTNCKYVEHESGPELLLYLGLGIATLGLARESLSVVKSAIELIAVILKARRDGQKQGDTQHSPLIIIVRGLSSDGSLYEKQVLEADLESPPTKEVIEKSLADAIQVIAEERVRGS